VDQMVVWICKQRYRWYPDENPGCIGRSDHRECGWYQLRKHDGA